MNSNVFALVGIVVAVVLIAVLIKFLNRDKIEKIMKKRKATSLLVCSGIFVEGTTRFDVAIAIDQERIYYENDETQSFLDLKLLEEVEYDEDLSTGSASDGDVLRLRSHGHTFEFILSKEDARRCQKVLPQHRADEPGDVHAESAGAS